MSLKNFNIFVEVVKYQSFSIAAEALNLTQPTVSKAIDNLEDELGVILFKKGVRKRELKLTYTGQVVYQHAVDMLAAQQNMYAELEQLKRMKKGKLKLGLPPLGSVLFSHLIALFHKQYPEIEINFLEVGSNGIEVALAEKSVDVGILLGNLRPSFESIPVLDSPMCLLSKKQSQWLGKDEVQLSQLKEESFLLFDDTFTLNNKIIQACIAVGFEPNIVCKSGQWDFIVKMVENNMGIALLPKMYCDQVDQNKFNITQLTHPNLNWTLSMAWNASVAMSPATKAWLNIVEKNRDKIHF